MSLAPWWERLPARLLREHAALEHLAADPEGYLASFAWRREEQTLVLTAQLRAWRLKGVEIRFPSSYPEGCPDVRPFPYVSLSTHQYVKTGALCLEIGPDNWHSELLAASLIVSAARLELAELVQIVEGVPVPSRHVDPAWSRPDASSGHALVLSRSAVAAARAADTPVTMQLATLLSAPSLNQFWVRAVPAETDLLDLPPPVVDGLALPLRGWILPDVVAGAAVPRSRDDLNSWLLERNVTLSDASLVFMPNATPSTALRVNKDKVDELYVIEVPEKDVRRPASLAGTADKRVGIVGLGSLGSKVALSLARSGQRRFTLVDSDLLLAENISRHAAVIDHVGMLKARATEDLIRSVAFDSMAVDVWPYDVGGSIPAELHGRMLESLADCDVLVDATADAGAHALLAGLASDHGRPLVWSEVWAGGVGGLLAWADLGRTPCPRCIRRAYLSELSTFPPAPFRTSDERYATGGDEPLVASDADVTFMAAVTARTTLDLLSGGLGEGVDPIVLFGLQPGWIFARPFETRAIRCWPDDWSCSRCWRAPTEPSESDSRAVAKLLT